LANGVFHTLDPKLGFNRPQSIQMQAEDIICLNMRLLHSDCDSRAAGHLGVSDGQSESECY